MTQIQLNGSIHWNWNFPSILELHITFKQLKENYNQNNQQGKKKKKIDVTEIFPQKRRK